MQVWDLVLNSSIAKLTATQARVTQIIFSKDFKTMIVGCKDGSIAFYNTTKQYKLIQVLSLSEILNEPDQEVNAL